MPTRGSFRRILLGTLALCCSAHAASRGSIAASNSPDKGVVRLPVMDGKDIQFARLSATDDSGEALQGIVVSIAQDRYGFLWFGTSDGLYRSDGYNLKSYRHESGNPNSLSDDTILAVCRDRAGILW